MNANPLFNNEHDDFEREQALRTRQIAHQEQRLAHEKLEFDEDDKRTEAHRIGGNYLNVKDPSCPPYSPFYVMITGHIQSGTFNDKDGICCMFDFHAGRPDIDWVLHSVSLFQCNLLKGQQGRCFSACLQITANQQTSGMELSIRVDIP